MKKLGLIGIWFICIFCAIVSLIWMLLAIIVGSDRAWYIAVAYDRVGNTTTGGPNTRTISDRANTARLENQRWGCILCKLLSMIQKDHCEKSAGN